MCPCRLNIQYRHHKHGTIADDLNHFIISQYNMYSSLIICVREVKYRYKIFSNIFQYFLSRECESWLDVANITNSDRGGIWLSWTDRNSREQMIRVETVSGILHNNNTRSSGQTLPPDSRRKQHSSDQNNVQSKINFCVLCVVSQGLRWTSAGLWLTREEMVSLTPVMTSSTTPPRRGEDLSLSCYLTFYLLEPGNTGRGEGGGG